jgi:hypothetical protein
VKPDEEKLQRAIENYRKTEKRLKRYQRMIDAVVKAALPLDANITIVHDIPQARVRVVYANGTTVHAKMDYQVWTTWKRVLEAATKLAIGLIEQKLTAEETEQLRTEFEEKSA